MLESTLAPAPVNTLALTLLRGNETNLGKRREKHAIKMAISSGFFSLLFLLLFFFFFKRCIPFYNLMMKRAWLIITTYKRLLSFLHSDYGSFDFFFRGGGRVGEDVLEMERWINFKQSHHFGRNAIFILFANPSPEWTLQKWHFQISLSSFIIDRQIKMNLSGGSTLVNSICSSDGLFLFSLKHNLSFLFKIPSSLSLSLSLSLLSFFNNIRRGLREGDFSRKTLLWRIVEISCSSRIRGWTL